MASPLTISFQSSPGLVTGRYAERVSEHAIRKLFQSSPGLVTGRYIPSKLEQLADNDVSILARSGDRALRLTALSIRPVWRFQSSPGLVTGRYQA